MKTSRHPPNSGFPRHLRDTRLFRKILKSQHAAAYDISASSKNPQQHGAPTYCTGRDSLNWMGPVQLQKKAEEQIITEIEITPPPPYYEDPEPRPAVREVTRVRPTAHETNHEARSGQSTSSLGTTVLTTLPPLPTTNHQRAATYSPFSSLDDIHLPRSTSTAALLPPPTAPTHLSATSYQPTRPTTPTHHHPPVSHLPTHASPLRSHPVHPPAAKPALPPLTRRAHAPVPALLSPIHEEPPPTPRPRLRSPSPTHSILRRTSSPTRPATKHVRFAADDADEGTARRGRDRIFLLPAVLASLVVVLALAEVLDGVSAAAVRVEYVAAFAVGCGIARGVGPAVVGGVEEVVGRAREEGWV
ncbi:hypothetical protein GTA08_BOTSDO03779 [Neofusicoccum parvum]|uniref:Uncharacterized protein n=1 Tax=Neofusicoccum parvum TaxID=310453 RepID=A0ACB5SFC1_9PEZI|nr:hypothetical protein GTA08_BOTSDO03779 [Neofusicoccum parvum]